MRTMLKKFEKATALIAAVVLLLLLIPFWFFEGGGSCLGEAIYRRWPNRGCLALFVAKFAVPLLIIGALVALILQKWWFAC